MPKFKSKVTGTVYANGAAVVEVEEGKQVTVDDPNVAEALRNNPDLEEVKDSKKK